MRSCLLLLLLAVFSLQTAHAQKKRSLDIGVNFYPSLSVPALFGEGAANTGTPSGIQNTEQWKPSFGMNAWLGFQMGKLSRLQVGLGYINQGRKSDSFPVPRENPIWERAPQTTSFEISYNHIELILNYQHLLGERMYWVAGFSPTVNIRNSIVSVNRFSTGEIVRIPDLKPASPWQGFNLALNLGWGYDLLRTSSLRMSIQPYLQYFLKRIAESPNAKHNYLNVGGTFSFSFGAFHQDKI